MLHSYTPSQADVTVFKAISSAPNASANPHVARWYNHIKSYEAEFGSLSGSSSAGEAFLGGAAAAPAKAEEDDDEVDLFGSDDEEDAEAERVAGLVVEGIVVDGEVRRFHGLWHGGLLADLCH